MGQRVFFSWKDDDATFDINRRTLGIIEKGLYKGFDADLSTVSGNLRLIHTLNSGDEVDILQNVVAPFGLIVTRQGAIIRDDTIISLPISPNLTLGFDRIDTIFVEHEYTPIVGGTAASYGVIEGTVSGVAPALVYPKKQVVLGYVNVIDGFSGSDLWGEGCYYTKEPIPTFAGDPNIMYTNKAQTSTAHKKFSSLSYLGTKNAPLSSTGFHTGNINLANQQSNIFEIQSQGYSDYFTVNDIILTGGVEVLGQPIYFITQQSLKFADNANFLCKGDRRVKAGQGFFLISIAGAAFTGTKRFLVVQAGEALKADHNKFKKLQSLEFDSSLSIQTNSLLNIGKVSNAMLIDNATVGLVSPLKFITSGNDTEDAVALSSEGGTRIQLLFSADCVLQHNQPSIPTGGKVILTPNANNVTVKAGGLVELLETPNGWEVISVSDSEKNLFNIWTILTTLTLDDLIDVTINSGTLTTDDVLLYNSGTAQWENTPILPIIRNRVHNFTKSQWQGFTSAEVRYIGHGVGIIPPTSAGFDVYLPQNGNIFRVPMTYYADAYGANFFRNLLLGTSLAPVTPQDGYEVTLVFDYNTVFVAKLGDAACFDYVNVGNIAYNDIISSKPFELAGSSTLDDDLLVISTYFTERNTKKSAILYKDVIKLTWWSGKWRIMAWNGNIMRSVDELYRWKRSIPVNNDFSNF